MQGESHRRHDDTFATIPSTEIEAFLGRIPRRIRLFPSHTVPAVRAIDLRCVYRSVLLGLNFIIRVCNEHKSADRGDFLTLFLELQTSLNPFLSANRHVKPIVAALAARTAQDIDAALSADFLDLRVLCDLIYALPELGPAQRRQLGKTLSRARGLLRKDDPYYYLPRRNPVLRALRRNGRLRASRGNHGIWDRWLNAVVDAGYAAFLGIQVDVEDFYRRTVAEIREIPFDEEYCTDLANVLTHASFGLSRFNRIAMSNDSNMDALATHGWAFFDWIESNKLDNDDPETLAAILDAFMKGPSRYYDSDPRFGTLVHRILESQAADGSWCVEEPLTIPTNVAQEALYKLYHPTWVCIVALRPQKHDLLDPRNQALGLV